MSEMDLVIMLWYLDAMVGQSIYLIPGIDYIGSWVSFFFLLKLFDWEKNDM